MGRLSWLDHGARPERRAITPSRLLFLDVASAAIPEAADYLDPVAAPKNYSDPIKIAAYVADKTAERVRAAGLDLDLARITALGYARGGEEPTIHLCQTEDDERAALRHATEAIAPQYTRVVTYNGFGFDLPLMMRRAKYLGVTFPRLVTDRYRSDHHDLLLDLSDRDPSRRRLLSFYARRLGWTDLVKPLVGEEEARIFDHGRWQDLWASVAHDLEATRRLATWWGLT